MPDLRLALELRTCCRQASCNGRLHPGCILLPKAPRRFSKGITPKWTRRVRTHLSRISVAAEDPGKKIIDVRCEMVTGPSRSAKAWRAAWMLASIAAIGLVVCLLAAQPRGTTQAAPAAAPPVAPQ